EGTAQSFGACGRLLASAPDAAARSKLLESFDLGLPARACSEFKDISADFQQRLAPFWSEASTDRLLIRILARLGDSRASQRATALAGDPQKPAELRAAMLQLL